MTLLQILLIAFVLLATGWGFALLWGVGWLVDRFSRRK